LFDDVITTGSTLDACAEALKEDGAEQVYGMNLFYD
jgi:predicted amidophosphoribosyltransferase